MVHCIYGGVTGYTFPNRIAFLSLKIVFDLENNVDPDEMLLCAAFHLDLHCLLKCSFSSQKVKSLC